MKEILVSVAEFRANLSRILSESRLQHTRIIVTSRKKPIATVVSYVDTDQVETASLEGLASLAGKWTDLDDIPRDIDRAYNARSEHSYREISF